MKSLPYTLNAYLYHEIIIILISDIIIDLCAFLLERYLYRH